MEWLRISTSTELVRVATDEIVYVRADGNYSDLMLTNGKSRKMTFQLHFFDEVFQQLQNNMFARVGRSLIVNKRYHHSTPVKPQTSQFSTNAHTDIPERRDTSNNVSKKSRTEVRMELIRKLLERKRSGVDSGLSDFDNADK